MKGLKGWNYLDLQYKGFVSLDVDEMVDGVMKKVTKDYFPLKMDFKTPAEHHIPMKKGSTTAPEQPSLEVQISLAESSAVVGNAEAKTAAVVSVFFNEDAEAKDNSFVEELKIASKGARSVDGFSLNAFMNHVKVDQYYVYDGSLTEPPCTEGVKWILLPEVKAISTKQATALKSVWKNHSLGLGAGNKKYLDGNARATQDINDRKVTLGNNWFESGAEMLSSAAIFTTATLLAVTAF